MDIHNRLQSLGLGETLLDQESIDLDLFRDRLSTRLMDVFRVTGNQEAYDLLFDLNKVRLHRVIAHRLRYLHLALEPVDVMQEAFFNAYRYPDRFRPARDNSFRVWMGAIVNNVIRRSLKRNWNRVGMLSSAYEPNEDELLDLEQEPFRCTEEQESRERLSGSYFLFLQLYLECFRSLPLRDRKVLRLVEVEERKYQEVGRMLATKAGNVKMLVFRARQRLFAKLKERMESRFVSASQ